MAYINGKEVLFSAVVNVGGGVGSSYVDEAIEKVNTDANNNFANAIKKTVSGLNSVILTDVSPIEHNIKIKITCPSGVDPTVVQMLIEGDGTPMETFSPNASGVFDILSNGNTRIEVNVLNPSTYPDGITVEVEYNQDTSKAVSSNVVVERMLERDKRGLESGVYNKEQYDTFRQKYPNRVYLEKYNKYPDGSEVEQIYNKVALTAYPDPPLDFDEGDEGYMLESVPTRCGGGFPDSATAYQKGHIRVPALSIDEFPTEDDAQSFATPKKYVDTAIIKAFDKKDFKKINRYANTIDDKCIGVTATNGVSSGLQIYDNDGKSKYAVFKCSLWRDNSSSGGDASLELHLTDSSGIALCYAIIFPYNTQQSYLSRPGGKRVYFDAKVHLPYGKWSEVYLEYDANACARLYIDDELVAETTDINLTHRPINVQVISSRALQGHIALTNISFLTADIPTELTDAYRFYYDNSSDWFTTSATTGKRIARYGSDTWEIQSVENFTGEGEYVVVNKKYLRKMLGNAGGDSNGSGASKMYKHTVNFNWCCEAAYYFAAIISFNSTDSTPINTQTQFLKNAEKIKTAEIVTVSSFYYEDIMNEVDYYEVVSIEVSASEFLVYYRMSPGGSLLTARYWATHMSDGSLFELTVDSDTVTEV